MRSCMWRTTLDRVRLVSERSRRKYKYVSNVCLEHFAFFYFSNLRFFRIPFEILSAVWSFTSSTTTSSFLCFNTCSLFPFLLLLLLSLDLWLLVVFVRKNRASSFYFVAVVTTVVWWLPLLFWGVLGFWICLEFLEGVTTDDGLYPF